MELPASRTYITVEVRDEEAFQSIDWKAGERPHWWTSFPTEPRRLWPDNAGHVVWTATWPDSRGSQTFYDLDQVLWYVSPRVVEDEPFEFEDAFRELFLRAPIEATVFPGSAPGKVGRQSLSLPTPDAVHIGDFRMDAVNCYDAARYAIGVLTESQRWLKAYRAATEDFVLTLADQIARGIDADGQEPWTGYQLFDPNSPAYLGMAPSDLLAMSRRSGGHYYARDMAEAVDSSNRGLRVAKERERLWEQAVQREFKWQLERIQKSYYVPRTSDEHEALRLHRAIAIAPRGTAARVAAEKARDDFVRDRLALPELAGSVYEKAYRDVVSEESVRQNADEEPASG